MLLEIDEVAIDAVLWEGAKAGDEIALDGLRRIFDGMVLSLHALHTEGNEILVTVRDLQVAGVIQSVTLHRAWRKLNE